MCDVMQSTSSGTPSHASASAESVGEWPFDPPPAVKAPAAPCSPTRPPAAGGAEEDSALGLPCVTVSPPVPSHGSSLDPRPSGAGAGGQQPALQDRWLLFEVMDTGALG